MKRLLLSTIFLLTLCIGYADEPMAEITFDKTSHNFGTFSEKNPVVTCIFSFKNTGNAPLIINQAIASCGCTIPTYTEKPVLPGQKGEIKVTYNGKGFYPGKFKKIITVRTNSKTRLVRLNIEGEMTASDSTGNKK